MAIVIGLMNRKGGAGKSTLTKLLASAVAHSKKKCLVIDLDPAEDILKWWTRAESKGHYDEKIMVRSTVVAEDLYDIVAKHDDAVDFIIIDTKGEGAEWADDLAGVVDRIVVPCTNANPDRDRTRETIAWYDDLKKRVASPDQLPPLQVVLTRVPPVMVRHKRDMPKPKEITGRDFERHYEIVSEFNPLVTMVPERPQYREMDEQGLLGGIMERCRNGQWSDKGQALHYESALAHAIDLMNNIIEGSKMEQTHGA